MEAPTPIDVQDLQFKLHSKLKIFDPVDESKFKCATSLVVAASRYGLVFVGTPKNTLEVIQTKIIESSDSVKRETSNFSRRSIQLPSFPSHLSLNCDQTLLAVVINKNGCSCGLIYQVTSFLSQNASPVQEIRLSPTPNVNVLETGWNPTIPTVYTACKEDGSLTIYELKGNSVDINEIPPAAGARCFSWSPKGKQIVVGSANGSLTQYKPDLKAVKAIQSPTLENGPCSVVNVYWLSNYQFLAVYHSINKPDSRPSILIVNSSKTGAVGFINYDDICYSYGTLRNPQYYILYQPIWNVILVSSANSMEVGVLGVSQAGEPTVWQQWNQIDASRAELPLHVQNETFPLGFAFDTGIVHQLPWGENQTLPPMPMIHIISHYGILCSFNVINLKQGVPMICAPPEAVPDVSGLSQFVVPPQNASTPPPILKVPSVSAPSQLPQNMSNTEQQNIGNLPPSPSLTSSTITIIPQSSFQPTTQVNFGFNNQNTSSAPNTFFTTPSSAPNLAGYPLKASEAKTDIRASTADFAFVSVKPNTPTPDPNSQPKTVTFPPPQPKIPPTPSTPQPTQKITQPTPEPITKTTPNKKPDNLNNYQPSTIKTPTKEESTFNDVLYNNMIHEEIKNFQKELNSLLGRCKSVKLNVGSEEEKMKLVKSADSLEVFFKELQDITESHVTEVHYLKQALIQSFAWYEDAKSRHRRFIDPQYTTLLILQELDPISEKQLADIQHLIYYIDSQLKLVDDFLDNQWADFQDSCKKQVRRRIEIPPMEPVYQTMVRINGILARQKYILKDISVKIKAKNKTGILPRINPDNKDVSDIGVEFGKLNIDPVDIFSLKYDKIVKTQQRFSKTKEDKLCEFFTNRQIFHVSPKKPKFSSSLNSSMLYNNEMSKQNLMPSRAVKSLSFENENDEFNNTAEANLSSSNIFTFSLDSSIKNVTQKLNKSDIEVKEQPISDSNKSDVVKTSSVGIKSDISGILPQSSINTMKSTFDFNKSIDSMKSNFGANAPPAFTQTMMVSQPVKPIDSNLEDQEKVTLNFKNSTAKIVMSPSEKTDTKLNFNFTQPKPNVVSTTDSKAKSENDKDFNNTFGFGSQLTLGQISTPKPKPSQPNNNQTMQATSKTSTTPSISIIPVTNVKDVPKTAATFNFVSKMPISTPTTTVTFTSGSTSTSTPISTVSSTNIFSGGITKAGSLTTNTSIFGTTTTTTTSNSVFGSTPSTVGSTPLSTPSTFGANVASPAASTGLGFGSTVSFTPTTVSTFTSNGSSTAGSLFGSTATTTTAIFKSTLPSTTTGTTVSTTPSAFGSNTSQSTVFGSNVATPTTTSLFGSNVTSPTPATTAFKTDIASSTTTSVFGTNVSSPTTSIFGSNVTPPTITSVFGANNATPTTTSIFGTSNVSATNTGSIFGSATPTTMSGSIFGKITSTTSIFKTNASTTNTPTSLFNTVSSSVSSPQTVGSIFGSPAPATSPQNISQPSSASTTPIAQMTSIFGANTSLNESQNTETSSTTQPFGQTPTTSNQNTFSFGNLTVSALSPKTTATTPFSFTLPTTTQQSIFNTNVFAKTNASTFMGQPICSPAQTQAATPFGQSTGNIFAQKPTTNTGSVFGQTGTSVFGNTPTTGSLFGQNTNSLFTSPNTTSSASTFRQNAFNTMNTSASTGSIFGQSTFGQAPTTSTSNSFSFTQNAPSAFANQSNNVFGAKPTFGQNPTFGQPAVFGSTAPAFGSPNPTGTAFGGASPQPGTFGGFGASPTFGSPPAFGQSAFGAPPTFGSPPAFGSPTKVFGSPGATSTFGSVQENSTFANLARQNTVGFGNLAQGQAAAPSPQVPQFSGGSQFSSWR